MTSKSPWFRLLNDNTILISKLEEGTVLRCKMKDINWYTWLILGKSNSEGCDIVPLELVEPLQGDNNEYIDRANLGYHGYVFGNIVQQEPHMEVGVVEALALKYFDNKLGTYKIGDNIYDHIPSEFLVESVDIMWGGLGQTHRTPETNQSKSIRTAPPVLSPQPTD